MKQNQRIKPVFKNEFTTNTIPTNAGIDIDTKKELLTDKKNNTYEIIETDSYSNQELINSYKESTQLQSLIQRYYNGDINALNKKNGDFRDITHESNDLLDISGRFYDLQQKFEKSEYLQQKYPDFLTFIKKLGEPHEKINNGNNDQNLENYSGMNQQKNKINEEPKNE